MEKKRNPPAKKAPLAARPSKRPQSLPTDERHPFLLALGERVRTLRARRGLTRKAVAQMAEISERHWANLEYGIGNASVLVLLQVASALQCSLSELLGDVTTSSPEWLLIRELLEHRSGADLQRAHRVLAETLGQGGADVVPRSARIALVGLRGAGKSALGQRLAEALGYPFIELSRQIEQFAGCSIHEIVGPEKFKSTALQALTHRRVLVRANANAGRFHECKRLCGAGWMRA